MINIKKCGKITTLKLLMVIIIKIIMDMLAMKELIMHGVIQHTPIITIIIINLVMAQDMVAMVAMAMEAMVAMEWDIMLKVKMKIAGTAEWMIKKKKATIQPEMKLPKMQVNSESIDQAG